MTGYVQQFQAVTKSYLVATWPRTSIQILAQNKDVCENYVLLLSIHKCIELYLQLCRLYYCEQLLIILY